MARYRLAVFDLDGTLLYTLDDLTASVNYALESEGLPERSKDEIQSFVGNGIRRLIDLSLPKGTEKDTADRVFSLFKSHYALHSNDNTRPYEGILPMLRKLKETGVRLALVSNKADFAVKSLAEKYFGGLLDIAVGEKEGIPRKPHPSMVENILQSLSVEKEDAVYIGDSDVDILTAKNAGIDCISVTWGFRDREFLIENGGRVFADNASELFNKITE